MRESLTYIPRVTEHKVFRSADQPFQVEVDIKRWRKLNLAMHDFIAKKLARERAKKSQACPEILEFLEKYAEVWCSLHEGTVRLINFVISEAQAGQPISTLVFLDKSARPAAYLFRLVWAGLKHEDLKQKGLISVPQPQIKFMDSGRAKSHKFRSTLSRSQALQTQTLTKMKLKGRVVVVDEFMESGESARNALRVLSQFRQLDLSAVSQFNIPPRWQQYTNRESWLGVTEAETNFVAFLELLTDQEWQELQVLTTQAAGAAQLETRLEQLQLHIGATTLQRFIQSSAGLTTIPMRENRVVFLLHREILAFFAQKMVKSIRMYQSTSGRLQRRTRMQISDRPHHAERHLRAT